MDRVQKVLREVKIQDDIKEPQDLPEKWIAEFDDIPDDDGVDKVLKAVEDEISVLEESYGVPILDLLVRAIKVRRARGERALPLSGAGDVESKQDMIEVVSDGQSPTSADDGAEPVTEAVAEPVVDPVAEPVVDPVAEPLVEPVSKSVAELESLGFSL